jgi:hypothetical protein
MGNVLNQKLQFRDKRCVTLATPPAPGRIRRSLRHQAAMLLIGNIPQGKEIKVRWARLIDSADSFASYLSGRCEDHFPSAI